MNVSFGIFSNAVERQVQFYQYPATLMYLRGALRLAEDLLLYAQFAWPSNNYSEAVSSNYKNSAQQTFGIEYGSYGEHYIIGINYRNFSSVNPAGIWQRDLLNWSSSIYARGFFDLFSFNRITFALEADSYMDMYSVSTKVDNTLESTLDLYWNFEAALKLKYFIQPLGLSTSVSVGGAYSIIDLSNQALGLSSTHAPDRTLTFVGLRYGATLQKWIQNINIRVSGFYTPSLEADYVRLDNKNQKQTSLAYGELAVLYSFGF